MPTLADIYSAIDSAKRRASDFVQNPGTSLQQMLGNANDRARAYNQQMYLAGQGTVAQARGQQPTPEQQAAEQDVTQAIAGAYNPVGMTVFHGSPHVFERFDMSKLGTGEGAQAYGRGMYVAQNPNVAGEYQKSMAGRTDLNERPSDPAFVHAVQSFRDANYPLEQIPAEMKKAYSAITDKDIKLAIQATDSGNLYKVDLPDTHIRRMLDWDTPLKDQPKPVRNLAKSLGIDLNDLGGDLIAVIGKGDKGKQILQDAGIPGIKYLDEKSRWSPHQVDLAVKGQPYASNQFATKAQAEQYAKEKQAEGFSATYKNVGTKNFVVFDDKHLKILERNPK